MKHRLVGLIWAAIAASSLIIAGCGDSNIFGSSSSDSGSESKLEKGVSALNDQNWDKAIVIFESLYEEDPNPENAKYLASAYVGKSGFDTLELIKEIAAAEDEGVDESVIYDSVTKLFDDNADGLISASELEAKGDLFLQALEVLVPGFVPAPEKAAAQRTTERSPSDGERFQAGLYAAAHAVLSIVAQAEYPEGSGQLLLTLEQLQAHPEVIDTVEAPDTLDQDLALVSDARDVLIARFAGDADKNKIAQEFDKFLSDADGIGYESDTHVTTAELRAYLHKLLSLAGGGT